MQVLQKTVWRFLKILEPDNLECKVKWAFGTIIKNKASGGDGISAELLQI